MILTIKTDQPEAQICLYQEIKKIDEINWQGHRQLSSTILLKIEDILSKNDLDKKDLESIVVFKGPGSFTGLRIGITVANTLASALHIPIVSNSGDDWIEKGLTRLSKGENEEIATPEYGSEANITKPKK